MARKAGVTAAETRAQLLEAAADVFAEKGNDGASISAITRTAGLSSGAIYAHYGSKADLFLAVLEEFCRGQFRHLIGTPAVRDVVDFAAIAGSRVDRREPRPAALMLEAIVAAKRDPEVRDLVMAYLADGEAQIAGAVKAGQHAGTVAADVGDQAFSRFVTMIGLGSALAATVGLPAPDHHDWAALVERLAATLRA